MKIIREDKSESNFLSLYQIAINLVGYISLYNALTELYSEAESNRNLESFMRFANNSMLKDMAIELNELYKYSESLAPESWSEYSKGHKDFEEFRKFLKRLRNSMKFFPKQKVIDNILEKSKNKYPTNTLKIYKNDIYYYCGYFLGNNLVFGSNLYYEYVFYEPLRLCEKNEDLFKFTNCIAPHLKSFFDTMEKILFNGNLDIPKIKLKKRKRFFQIYTQTTKFEKMIKKSKYDKTSIFIFMLLIEEISGMEIYLDYMLDLDKSIKNPILLYFFTQFVAIKYDQIRDAIDLLIKDGKKFNVNVDLLEKEVNELDIFSKNTTDFAYKLRNFHHFTEVEKYKILVDENDSTLKIDFTKLYTMVTNCDDFNVFKDMLNTMKNDLHILVKFLRKNVGIKY